MLLSVTHIMQSILAVFMLVILQYVSLMASYELVSIGEWYIITYSANW